MAIITKIDKYSIAAELKLKRGDEILSFDDKPFVDILDYCYYDGQDNFKLTVKRGRKVREYMIEKLPNETLGIEFDSSMELSAFRCKNKCKFCFVDQLPKGMRDTMYVKDDDYRLSFVAGNYITLTNVGDVELKRIIDMRLSPLYISVHSTDISIKENLVSNPEALKTYDKMSLLKANGIKMHAQIVMCQSINDGQELTVTLTDLARLIPELATVAVVPSGLTRHRDGLFPLLPVTKETAADAIERINAINEKCGYNFAFASDEMYLRAEQELPKYEYYGSFEQIENGVGLMRSFERELDERIAEMRLNTTKIAINCATGMSFGDFLCQQVAKIADVFPNVEITVNKVRNDFFGESITVAGLITGGDLIAQLSGKVAKHLVIPSNMLREFTDRFLDDISIKDVEIALDTTVHSSRGGGALVDIIADIVSKIERTTDVPDDSNQY